MDKGSNPLFFLKSNLSIMKHVYLVISNTQLIGVFEDPLFAGFYAQVFGGRVEKVPVVTTNEPSYDDLLVLRKEQLN